MQAMASAIGVDDDEHRAFLQHVAEIRDMIRGFAVESWLEELPSFVDDLEARLRKYSVALRGFQASVAARQVEGEPPDLWEPYYEFLTRLRISHEQDEVSEEDFEWYNARARLALSEFDSSDNPGELFGAEEDASPTATAVPAAVPVVPSVSMPP